MRDISPNAKPLCNNWSIFNQLNPQKVIKSHKLSLKKVQKSEVFAIFFGYLSHKTLIFGALAKTITSDSHSELVFDSTDAVLWIIPSNMKKKSPSDPEIWVKMGIYCNFYISRQWKPILSTVSTG